MALATQLDIPLAGAEAHDALHYWADSLAESRGEVFTKTEVVEFILDLVGWQVGQSLLTKRLLEPSCGSGDFVVPVVRRLLADAPHATVGELLPCIRAVEVNRAAFDLLVQRVRAVLETHGFSSSEAATLTSAWLLQADFLTQPFSSPFTHVVGNPPYLRIEALPRPLMQRYRALFRTMYDRADLYIAFYEKGLSLLAPEGRLGYICANRWTKNRYGGPLREMIAESFHMDVYVDFTGVDAFHGEVTAYPSVTIIRNGSGEHTQIIDKEDVLCANLPELSGHLLARTDDPRIKYLSKFKEKRAPWLLSNAARLLVVKDLEHRLPTLEKAGCKVGIGVATGADKVYIGTDAQLDVEAPAYGIENHLNYFHQHQRGLPPALTRGLSAFLNSTLFDEYFRQFNGHTQVNATDLHRPAQPGRTRPPHQLAQISLPDRALRARVVAAIRQA